MGEANRLFDYDDEECSLTGEADDVDVEAEGSLADALDSVTVDQDEDKNDSAAVLAMEAVLLKAHKVLLAKRKKHGKEKTQNEFARKRKPTVAAVTTAGDTSTEEARSKPPKKGKCERSSKRWSNEDTALLIDMLEERPCLWDTGSKDYHSRNKRAKAIEDIQDTIGIPPTEIKLKITSLRGQLGRELAKVSKTKSGQSVDDCYKSTWIFWERLQFLRPVMQPGNSRDSMQSSSETSPESLEITVDLEESSSTPSSKKKQ
eukprot:Seg8859.2 transcript_id=Seg8859.2/GoldUCD/mRNA.D3Y31 product="hypothetical protein" protein_id=Seg8859.2/GoldUCD/D3Y31